eukprot:11779933-Ditylum_brightwellii.AAC.1
MVNWFHKVLGHPGCDHLSLPEKQDFRQRIWFTAGKGNANSTLGRSSHQFNWPLEGQGQWQVMQVPFMYMH